MVIVIPDTMILVLHARPTGFCVSGQANTGDQLLRDIIRSRVKSQEAEAYCNGGQLSKNKETSPPNFLHALLSGSYEEEEIVQSEYLP